MYMVVIKMRESRGGVTKSHFWDYDHAVYIYKGGVLAL